MTHAFSQMQFLDIPNYIPRSLGYPKPQNTPTSPVVEVIIIYPVPMIYQHLQATSSLTNWSRPVASGECPPTRQRETWTSEGPVRRKVGWFGDGTWTSNDQSETGIDMLRRGWMGWMGWMGCWGFVFRKVCPCLR